MTKNKKIKRPSPKSGKRVKSHDAPGENFDARPPCFSFRYIQNQYSIDDCDWDAKIHILEALNKRKDIAWQRLKTTDRHGLGLETISQDAIKAPMPTCVTPDTTLLAFRCIGKAPMVGFREDDRFYVLWIDPTFSLYDHA